MDEISIDQALQELDTTLADLLRQSKTLPLSQHSNGIGCHHHWNPTAKTFSYHTHVVVPKIKSTAIEMLSTSWGRYLSCRRPVMCFRLTRQACTGITFVLPAELACYPACLIVG